MNNDRSQLSRREALQRAGAILGGVISLPIASAVLAGCNSPTQQTVPWQPTTLTADQNSLVTQIAELIIPETNTPGAREARVNEFVDVLLTDWYPDDERDHFLSGLLTVDEEAMTQFQTAFMDLEEEQQIDVLKALEAVEREDTEGALPTFFAMMKQMTLTGYYTSEIGATQEFNYLPVPGRFDGCVPVEDVIKSHA